MKPSLGLLISRTLVESLDLYIRYLSQSKVSAELEFLFDRKASQPHYEGGKLLGLPV